MAAQLAGVFAAGFYWSAAQCFKAMVQYCKWLAYGGTEMW